MGVGTWFRGTETTQVQMKTRAVAAIERLAPANSRYVADATTDRLAKAHPGKAVAMLAGILSALRADYEAGYLQGIEELIHADLFADFLQMAEELVGKHYKDAAAVIGGSVLEEHLRKLASRHGIATEHEGRAVNAAKLNDTLAAAESSYTKLTQKSVTAWLDLRNNAAHGHYEKYDQTQVEGMIRDVRGFMQRYPA